MGELTQSKLDGIHLNFYPTSIYDHSVFEAFSKVIQKLIPQLPTLENLLTSLQSVRLACLTPSRPSLFQNCRMEKCFLIDVVSKIYIASDSNPVDQKSYELCSDMIDVVIDISSIYGFTFALLLFFLLPHPNVLVCARASQASMTPRRPRSSSCPTARCSTCARSPSSSSSSASFAATSSRNKVRRFPYLRREV